MNTLFIDFSSKERGTIVLPCQIVEVNETVIVVKSLIVENPNILLFEVKHNQINTLFDLTKVSPYELWYFAQNQEFIAKSFSLQNGDAPFQIQTQARFVILIPTVNNRVAKKNSVKYHSFKIK